MKNNDKSQFYPVALTIAGSDSGGGAGIAADLRTFNALGVYGCCAVTAVTAQNPAAVRRIDALAAASVTAQINAVMENIAVTCCKTGMLFTAENVLAVAAAVKEHKLKLICDPVMVSTSGSKLLQNDAIEVIKSQLLPQAAWITPNIPEAELLLGRKIISDQDAGDAAGELANRFGCAVLLKGGHASGPQSCDFVARENKLYTLTSPRLDVPKLTGHGTGCTLSAALTAALALGLPWKRALCESKAFVFGSLSQSVEIGKKIHAMYPPVEDSIGMVKLAEVE
ncbi:MAG: bifunctional hydroxymethylpyrimidine kinase/phosphomethylpyrimidine kinase [Lentisphaeria bacterium]|nr:bifunctional hydroxymethylpyrimidine kinase/phosphomethylpyrimidine kinase [Lentisphaeria bacterium]